MQDGSVSSGSGEPAPASLEDGEVDQMSPGPPDDDRDLPAASQTTSYIDTGEENPENPTGKGGVAIVLNKQLTNWHNVQTKVIVPGQALLIKTRWHGDKDIIILGVYALNVLSSDSKESAEFFSALHDFFMEHPEW
ncbi:hypothetical protein EDD18DRAFT_1101826 [Armillaria luteobubalina]|uniref:Uncharacterized protein n=1 Tax=Armillaria luteobubalina TaxID=153913 RepID=A0AA39QDD4_9AGAR|nr:hypothetical protein EDD18DRAFT_1101826 [Armillaria luteobubalina]